MRLCINVNEMSIYRKLHGYILYDYVRKVLHLMSNFSIKNRIDRILFASYMFSTPTVSLTCCSDVSVFSFFVMGSLIMFERVS